ncbi:MAG: SEC-C domain-containing protein [Xanthomonadaceae bacterium]|nr:SEC-C domain-containing protein [Xanthomonadaceae bacterium]
MNEIKVSRNEPCPCGSGKKYKRCHGVNAPPVLNERKVAPGGALPGGMDPNAMNPEFLAEFTKMLSKLPKGQMQKLQTLMQRASKGKDVSGAAKDFEQGLPLELQEMLMNSEFSKQFEEAQKASGTSEVSAEQKEPSRMKKFFSKFTG